MIHEKSDDHDYYEPDESDCGETLSYKHQLAECPNCKHPVDDEMDSCPYCGDILFSYLTDATFSPPKGPLTKLFAFLIVLMVLGAVVGMLMYLIQGVW